MKAYEICAKAAELVSGDRHNTHGDKVQNFANIADHWNAILKNIWRREGTTEIELTALDVANMLESFKIARRYSGSHNPDDYIDGAGYAGCAGEIADALGVI